MARRPMALESASPASRNNISIACFATLRETTVFDWLEAAALLATALLFMVLAISLTRFRVVRG